MAKPTPDPTKSERRIQLRVDGPLYDVLHARAADEMRSLNATVVLLLRKALGTDAPPPRKRAK